MKNRGVSKEIMRNVAHAMRVSLLFFFQLSFLISLQAQASRHQLREGNRQYNKQRYDQAEVAYRRALERDSTDARGQYNLGSTLYRQKKYDEAASHYEQAMASPTATAKQRAQALHNRGNSYLKAGMESQNQQQLQQALASYQEALKLDPKNDDTRYNLALARHLLQQAQQQQQQQGGGGDNKNQNQQQNQQGQQQNQGDQQKKDNSQNQQGQQNQQDQQNQQGQQQRQQQGQQDMKKRDAERVLEAMGNKERQTLRGRERTDLPVKGKRTDKDW